MKQLAIFLIVLVTINFVASGNNPEDDDDLGTIGGDLCDDSIEGPIGCSDDCSARSICMNGEIVNVKCPSKLGIPRYCNNVNNECDQKQKCELTENNFKCPGRGTYPHLFNCHKLFMCTGKGVMGVVKSCGKLKKYDPASGKCESINICHNFSPILGLCLGKKNKIVVHPQNSKYYIHCGDSPILATCPAGHVFDSDSLKCVYKCTKSGLFVDEENEHCYYKCKLGFFKYTHENLCCEEPDDVFNEKLKMCGPKVTRKLQLRKQ